MFTRRLPGMKEHRSEADSSYCGGRYLSDQEFELVNIKIKYDFIRDIYAITVRLAVAVTFLLVCLLS